MDINFDGRTVLVTGASTGIGAALAVAYGACGAQVAVHYNSSEAAADAVVQKIRDAGGDAWRVQADLADPAAAATLAEQVLQHYGSVDVLVNNAGGLVDRRPTEEVTRELYDAVLQLNVGSVVALSNAVVQSMSARGSGSILNVSSVAAVTGGGPGASIYASAKGAVVSYTRAGKGAGRRRGARQLPLARCHRHPVPRAPHDCGGDDRHGRDHPDGPCRAGRRVRRRGAVS